LKRALRQNSKKFRVEGRNQGARRKECRRGYFRGFGKEGGGSRCGQRCGKEGGKKGYSQKESSLNYRRRRVRGGLASKRIHGGRAAGGKSLPICQGETPWFRVGRTARCSRRRKRGGQGGQKGLLRGKKAVPFSSGNPLPQDERKGSQERAFREKASREKGGREALMSEGGAIFITKSHNSKRKERGGACGGN